MDPDVLLVAGIVIGVLAIPSVLTALSENRIPHVAGILLAIATLLLFTAVQKSPEGYSIAGIPHVFYVVIGRYIH
jgi:hypothetical protein